MAYPILIAAFYKFVPLPNYRELRQPLLDRCRAAGVGGTILLAPEGINASIAGERHGRGVGRVFPAQRSAIG